MSVSSGVPRMKRTWSRDMPGFTCEIISCET